MWPWFWIVLIETHKNIFNSSSVKYVISFKEDDDRQAKGDFTTAILLNTLNHGITAGTESEQQKTKYWKTKINIQICRKSDFNDVLENTLVICYFIHGDVIFVSIRNISWRWHPKYKLKMNFPNIFMEKTKKGLGNGFTNPCMHNLSLVSATYKGQLLLRDITGYFPVLRYLWAFAERLLFSLHLPHKCYKATLYLM